MSNFVIVCDTDGSEAADNIAGGAIYHYRINPANDPQELCVNLVLRGRVYEAVFRRCLKRTNLNLCHTDYSVTIYYFIIEVHIGDFLSGVGVSFFFVGCSRKFR
jgi:hypothetical protein